MAIPAKNLSLGTNGEDYLVDYLNKNYLTKYKLKKVEKNPSSLLKNNHQQGDIFITCEDARNKLIVIWEHIVEKNNIVNIQVRIDGFKLKCFGKFFEINLTLLVSFIKIY